MFPDPHPNRADSWADRLGDYAQRVHGVELRPWQWLVADRLLEVDDRGRFCWSGGLMLVMPRQLGKSTLLAMVALWLAQEHRRVVVGTADTLRTIDRVQGPWRRWAQEQGFRATSRIDQPEIDFGHGGRWIGQAANDHLGVGVTVDVGLVDEAWDVPEVAVTRALTPAMSAVESPLLLLTSTASVGESQLMDRYRGAAERGVANVGLVEWAAPADADWRDEETWRAAHPHWSPQRLAYLRQQVEVVPPDDFKSQYLCIPQGRRSRVDSAPLIPPEVLHGLRRPGMQPSGHVVGAVECWYGEQSGAALAWRTDDGEVRVVGRRFDRIEQAFAWCGQYANETLVGLMWREHPGAQLLGAKGVGSRETVKALPLLRKLAADDRLRWDGDDLADQLVPLAVVEKDGVLKVTGGQHWIARPAAWAVWHTETQPALAPSIY